MRIVADESVDGLFVQKHRLGGCEVTYVAELDPGIVDEDVLALAYGARAVLLTADKDFGELVYLRDCHIAG